MSSGKRPSRIKALVKSIVSIYLVPPVIGAFWFFQWAIGYEIIPQTWVILAFLSFFISLPISWVINWLYRLLSKGKNSISPNNQGKFIHKSTLGLRLLFLGYLSVNLYWFLWIPVAHTLSQEKFVLIDFLLRNAIRFTILAATLYSVALMSFFRIEYDNVKISWVTALFTKKTRRWSDMIGIKEGSDGDNSILEFSGSDRMKVIDSYEAHDQIIKFAKSKLNNA